MSWNVYFFRTNTGKKPVREFILKQNARIRSDIGQSFELLSEKGPFLKPPYIKKLQDNIYELRIKSEITIRILYTFKGSSYYLLHAFTKKSQKTPKKEIKLAIDRAKQII